MAPVIRSLFVAWTLCALAPERIHATPLYIAVAFPNTTSYFTLPTDRIHRIISYAFREVKEWQDQGKLQGLDGYELTPVHISTHPVAGQERLSFGAAVMASVQALTNKRMVAFIGALGATVHLADVVHLYQLPMVNPSYAEDVLYNHDIYPDMVNIRSTFSSFTKPLIQLMDKFKWKRIAIIKDETPPLSTPGKDMEKQVKAHKHTLLASETFTPARAQHVVDRIKLSGARIIFAFVRPGEEFSLLMCQVYRHNLHGEGYVWFVQNWQDTSYQMSLRNNPSNCTRDEILEAVNHTFSMWYQVGGPKNTLTGKDPLDIVKDSGPMDHPTLLLYSYDGVWTTALAFNKTIPIIGSPKMTAILKDKTYKNRELTDSFLKVVSEVEFDGGSGRVMFNRLHSRTGSAQLVKIIDGKKVRMAIYSHKTAKFQWFAKDEHLWGGHGGIIPLDQHKASHLYRNQLLVYVYWAWAGLSTLLAIIYIVVVLVEKNKSLVLISCLTAIGAILLNASAVIQSLDVREIKEALLTTLCQISVWLHITAFSLFFGAMTVTACAIYAGFSKKQTKINECSPFFGLLILLAIDLAILVPWHMFDPMQSMHYTIPTQDLHQVRTKVSMCTSNYMTYWLIGVLSTKGLLILAGAFIIWPAWILSLRYGRTDTVYLGICMYIFIVSFVIGAPVSFLIQPQRSTLRYALSGGWKLFPTLLASIVLLSGKAHKSRQSGEETHHKRASPLMGAFSSVCLHDNAKE